MAPRRILIHPDPALRVICPPVTDFDTHLARLAQDMVETIHAAPGLGLAAPQIGMTCRIFVMDPDWQESGPAPQVLVNPEVLRASPARQSWLETCLSIPGSARRIARPTEVVMRWQDLRGRPQSGTFTGLAAMIAQHELDHLDGVLILDHAEAPAP